MQYEVVARKAGDGLQVLLRRIASLVGGVCVLATVVSAATFLTGWWVFRGSIGWLLIGGLLCLAPPVAALVGWGLVHGTARVVPRLTDDIATFIRTPSPAATLLIDHDTRQPITLSAKRFTSLKTALDGRRHDLPALWLGVRAVTLVPGLAAAAFVGMLAIGAFGTVLLLAGLIR